MARRRPFVFDYRGERRTIRRGHRSRPNNKLGNNRCQLRETGPSWCSNWGRTASIENKAILELGGPTGEAATFEGNRGTLFLDKANDFSGTVAGMAKRDAIDLADFAFSSHPSITSVVGTGAAGSITDVTITDASLTTTIFLNRYANQFAVAPSAYTLTSDHSGSASAGTLFTLAVATVHWSGVSGDWSTASDWSTDTAPGPSDKAVIAAPRSYRVTVTTPEDVGSVRLNDPGAILDIQSTLTVSGPVVVRSGTLKMKDRWGT